MQRLFLTLLNLNHLIILSFPCWVFSLDDDGNLDEGAEVDMTQQMLCEYENVLNSSLLSNLIGLDLKELADEPNDERSYFRDIK